MDIQLIPKKIDGVFEVVSGEFRDQRGFIRRLYDKNTLQKVFSGNLEMVQASLLKSAKKNTMRGLHVSLPPTMEGKLVVGLSGRMQWITLDLRKDSPTFGIWDSTILSADKNNGIAVVKGFAHGCVSLEDGTSVLAFADTAFSNVVGTGIRWDDPELKVGWEIGDTEPIISEGHKAYGSFKEFKEKYGAVSI